MAYAGDVTAQQAWERLAADPRSELIDVRTAAEWSYVGLPDLTQLGKSLLRVEWQAYPSLARNPQFGAELARAELSKDQTLFFLCRSGARSRAAAEAMTALGYRHCYNIADGFEGPRDSEGHRGRIAGWKASGLPWKQE
jgi:rhodanese-related sulfurtransferase